MLLEDAMDFAESDGIDATASADRFPEKLDPLALQVIALSRHGDLRSAYPESRGGRLIARLFGIAPAAPLADPKLEALRRYCIFFRCRKGQIDEAASALIEAGYSDTQRQLIDIFIEADRARS